MNKRKDNRNNECYVVSTNNIILSIYLSAGSIVGASPPRVNEVQSPPPVITKETPF